MISNKLSVILILSLVISISCRSKREKLATTIKTEEIEQVPTESPRDMVWIPGGILCKGQWFRTRWPWRMKNRPIEYMLTVFS
jgi:hypothetical protein